MWCARRQSHPLASGHVGPRAAAATRRFAFGSESESFESEQIARVGDIEGRASINILSRCPILCGALTPCTVQKYLSLPADVPFHWEVLCIFFHEPWALDACVRAIRMDAVARITIPELQREVVPRCPRYVAATRDSMSVGMGHFLDSISAAPPADFELQRSVLGKAHGAKMLGTLRVLKYLLLIDRVCIADSGDERVIDVKGEKIRKHI